MSEEYSEFIKKDKIVQQTVNGISRFLILWIIREKGPIHGYGLLKELNQFFESLIERGSLRKSSPSRVYPMLRDMEKNGFIKGETVVQENKKVTFYEITDFGEDLMFYIRDSYQTVKFSPKCYPFSDFLNEK
jgi:DNA-binding PadR family transcriptional regulator